ncbi:hypothetical protein [Streptomyces sp. HB132]|uniref:hypothetical protein n=1 Tax=Streptomyces sp. HB132 TaxID=767388 RepID=UPI0019607C62|nr:hypothetical protein [Streptomyces sp. HB132]MBM7438816.1 hypothetical protein [Streptomyces sp. HB132]
MHSDNHHLLHACRAAELRREAAEFALARTAPRRRTGWTATDLRRRAGWTMIELGLRLAQTGPTPTGAARTA